MGWKNKTHGIGYQSDRLDRGGDFRVPLAIPLYSIAFWFSSIVHLLYFYGQQTKSLIIPMP